MTDRGQPIAKIVPLRPAERGESRRERLGKAGVLQLGSGRARYLLFKLPKGPRVRPSVLEALLAEREEGR